MLQIVTLHSADEGDAEAAGEEGVFAVGFLTAPQRGSRKILMFGDQKVSP
jgi:hypothetical protein